MSYERMLALAKIWFQYFIDYPERENKFFNEFQIPCEYLSFFYSRLVGLKLITPIEKLDAESKLNLKNEVSRIDPNRSVEKGMKIARSIIVLGYLSNI